MQGAGTIPRNPGKEALSSPGQVQVEIAARGRQQTRLSFRCMELYKIYFVFTPPLPFLVGNLDEACFFGVPRRCFSFARRNETFLEGGGRGMACRSPPTITRNFV